VSFLSDTNYKKWAKQNDGVISNSEQEKIDRLQTDNVLIRTRILKIELAKGIITSGPEDDVMASYNTRISKLLSYYSNITTKNRNAVVVDQADMDNATTLLALVKEMHAYYLKNKPKIENYHWMVDERGYPIKDYEDRLKEVEEWKKETEERYKDSALLKDYKDIKREGPQPLVPPRPELLSEEYHDPELAQDEYGIIHHEFDKLPLYDEKGGIEATDVIQGDTIGDCYAISALSAIAKADPDLIKNNIKALGNGLYEVTLYIREVVDGKATERKEKKITVDSDFPAKVLDDGTKVPIYAHSDDAELWPMIMEKAYAKAMGGYDNIVGGIGEEALSVFTGKKPRNFLVLSHDSFSETTKIGDEFKNKDFTQKEFLKILSTAKMALFDSNAEATSASGFTLIKDHSYSLSSFDGNIIKLRNPHGKDDFEFDVKENNVWDAMSKVAIL
jgi:hypothetical protein